jgi:hypothetical protein
LKEKLLGCTCSAAVIDNDNPDDDSSWISLEENAGINLASAESTPHECKNKLVPKGKRHLEKTIERLKTLESIDIRVIVVFESLRRFHADLFSILQLAIEKSALNVKDMDWPTGHDREHKHNSD